MVKESFGQLLGQQIIKVYRVDLSEDYEFYMPFGVFLMFNKKDGFYFGATNDGKSIDIGMTTYQELYDSSGVEFFESFIHDLKKEDELNHLIDQEISEIKIAEYKNETISGNNFIIRQGKYAGLVLRAGSLTISFYNNQGSYLCTDELIQEFPNRDNWSWV